MLLDKLSKETFNFYAPRYEVEIDGLILPAEISKAILDVTIDEKITEGASFTITLNDEFDLETQEFKWLDDPLFEEGNKVTIKMGYENDLYTMLEGTITKIESSFFSGDIPTLTVKGQDFSKDYLKNETPEKTFKDKKYSEIAEKIASKVGLLSEVDDTQKFEPVKIKKNDETYYDFLKKLAGVVDYHFYVDEETMYFIKPKDNEKEILTLELNKDIISFSPVLQTDKLVPEVEVRWNNSSDPNAPFVGVAAAGSERTQEVGKTKGSEIAEERYENKKKVITNKAVISDDHAKSIALAELNKASDTLIEGNGECIGLPRLRKGVNIKIEKIGIRFSGKYYVKGTTHTINDSGYRTKFSVKRNAL